MVFLKRRRKIPLRAEDVMTMEPVTVGPETTLAEAARLMWERRIGSLLVVDDEGRLRGIITERDLVFAVSEAWDPNRHTVLEVMTENPITVERDADILTVVRKMRDANVRHMPVVDENGRPVGIISYRDVLDLVMTLMAILLGAQQEQ